jgi:hypothetical protein
MKNRIIKILETSGIDIEDLINIDIFSSNELHELEESEKDDFEDLHGKFEYALIFSDHPEYCYIRNNNSIKKTVTNWLKEMNLITWDIKF